MFFYREGLVRIVRTYTGICLARNDDKNVDVKFKGESGNGVTMSLGLFNVFT